MIDPQNSTHNQFLELSDGTKLRYKFWRSHEDNLNLPRILMLSGRAGNIEEFEHFILKVVQEGYDVWSFDWRGQGLSTRTLGQRGYIDSYDTYIKDLDQFIMHIMSTQNDTAPLVVIAHSMGSHIGLRYCAEHPGKVSAALLTAPMLDIYKGRLPRKLVLNFFKLICALGFEKKYFPQHKDQNVALIPFLNNKLTRNSEVFSEMRQLLLNHPELILGGVTFGWLRATLESINIIFSEGYLEKVKIPIHIIEAGNDRIVNNLNLNRICNMMENCSFEVIPEAGHQLLSELPEVQDRILNILNQLVESVFYIIPNYSYHERQMIKENLIDKFKKNLKNFVANKKSS